MAKRILALSEATVAKTRKHILDFYREYGEAATRKAFGVDRKLIYVWKQRLKANPSLLSLNPLSTRPRTVRSMNTHPQISAFIKDLRLKYPRLGKEKIKPLLDRHCLKLGLTSISVSTIGKVIKRNHYFYRKPGRIYHLPGSKWEQTKARKRLRVKYAPSHRECGHIQSDTVLKITNGIKEYFYSAIDTKLKFGLTLNYKSLNSLNNRDFYLKFKNVYPGTIRDWQTDNGQENLGEFDKELIRDGIPHLFTYPRCPKINGVIERYNRTIQEEFIDNHLDIIHDRIRFNQKLAEYVIFYLTERVHKSIGNKTPIDYLIEQLGMSKKTVTYTES